MTATAALLELHAMARPSITAPVASVTTAVSVLASPSASESADGVIVTVATGTRLTTIIAVPYLPSLVASICATPSATAVTTPVEDTVATAGRLEAHATGRPVIGFPAASASVAVSPTVAPTV